MVEQCLVTVTRKGCECVIVLSDIPALFALAETHQLVRVWIAGAVFKRWCEQQGVDLDSLTRFGPADIIIGEPRAHADTPAEPQLSPAV